MKMTDFRSVGLLFPNTEVHEVPYGLTIPEVKSEMPQNPKFLEHWLSKVSEFEAFDLKFSDSGCSTNKVCTNIAKSRKL